MNGLGFSLFRIPVRVELWFLALSVFLGAGFGFRDPASMFVFCGIVFVSVLAHELGHAFTGRAFGLTPAITLHGLGGLTSWTAGRTPGPGRSLLISLAGPAVGLLIGAFVAAAGLGVSILVPGYHPPELAVRLWEAALYVNLVWSIFNLFPIVPLDGGHALRSFWALTKLGDPDLVAHVVSIPFAVALGVFFARGGYFMPILMLFYVARNVQGIRARIALRGDEKVQQGLLDGYPRWLSSKDGETMIREGTRARSVAKTPHLAAYAMEIIAMGQCLTGDPRSALATLGAMPRGFAPSLDVALHVLDAAGEHKAAQELLRRAAEQSNDPELKRRLAERA